MVPDRPLVLITKRDGQLNLFSEINLGSEAWVLDWDNDMQPTPLSTVIAQSDMGPPVMAHRLQVCPHSQPTNGNVVAMRAAFKVAEANRSLSHTGRNIVLAALRSLQLHLEKDDVPQGIMESHFDAYDLPSVETLDRLCEALNT